LVGPLLRQRRQAGVAGHHQRVDHLLPDLPDARVLGGLADLDDQRSRARLPADDGRGLSRGAS
jgi:hypothetical protein